MARILYFRGQQIGDQVITWFPDNKVNTPVVRQAGLYRSTVQLNRDSRNLEYAFQFTLYVTRTTAEACVAAIEAIQQLQGLAGVVNVQLNAVNKLLTDATWILEAVSNPQLDPGFGGRFTDKLELRFVGTTPSAYS